MLHLLSPKRGLRTSSLTELVTGTSGGLGSAGLVNPFQDMRRQTPDTECSIIHQSPRHQHRPCDHTPDMCTTLAARISCACVLGSMCSLRLSAATVRGGEGVDASCDPPSAGRMPLAFCSSTSTLHQLTCSGETDTSSAKVSMLAGCHHVTTAQWVCAILQCTGFIHAHTGCLFFSGGWL
jgi:hypothetical protein